MNELKQIVAFFQENLVLFALVVAALIWFLIALAQFYVDITRITPGKEDDLKAKRFQQYVKAFVKFLRTLFKLDKKPDNKGFGQLSLLCLIAGMIIGAAIAKTFIKPKVETQVQVVEKVVEKVVFAEKKAEAKKKKTSIKQYADGSSETSIEESSVDLGKISQSSEVESHDPKLGIYLGAGLKSEGLFNLPKPMLSGIITYKNYAASAVSDLKKDHAAFLHYGGTF